MIIQYIATCHFSLAGNVQLMHRLYYTLIDLVNPVIHNKNRLITKEKLSSTSHITVT